MYARIHVCLCVCCMEYSINNRLPLISYCINSMYKHTYTHIQSFHSKTVMHLTASFITPYLFISNIFALVINTRLNVYSPRFIVDVTREFFSRMFGMSLTSTINKRSAKRGVYSVSVMIHRFNCSESRR